MTTRQIIHHRAKLASYAYAMGILGVALFLVLPMFGVKNMPAYLVGLVLACRSLGLWIFTRTPRCVHCQNVITGTILGGALEAGENLDPRYCPVCGTNIDLEAAAQHPA